MEKINEYAGCLLAVDTRGEALFLAGLPEHFDSWLSDIGDGGGAPTTPGLYLVDAEAWFEQGYSDGYKADGESDFEIRIIKARRVTEVVAEERPGVFWTFVVQPR